MQNGAIEQSTGPRATSAGDGGFTLLEQILEQKTFTRQVVYINHNVFSSLLGL